ncbi:hemerythrin [Sphaerisporangium rufum]|uniref:Hemerythrin n=1 Tax=Sphaerisporangium rufum TaxID=1381558 RepID=A0A919R7X0_9ACTN|nr:hemerythrin domain-containing protein [Sphaerisporangium rufum]GII80883.1 hemerythrin [Sphaerisporangium rufum]
METREDIISVLVTDHRDAEEVFGRLEVLQAAGDGEAKALAERMLAGLARHAAAEREHLYPAVRQHVAGAGPLVDQELIGHAEIERTMKRLARLSPSDADFWPALGLLMTQVREHVRGQESDLFPRLRAACPQERLAELGAKARRTQQAAPSRVRPAPQERPEARPATGPATGPLDRVRAFFGRRGKHHA